MEVVTVSVADTGAPDGVTELGERLHDASAAGEDTKQVRFTVVLKPYSGVTVIVMVPLCPAVTDIEEGDAATEKLGVMVYVALATALVLYPEAIAIALMVSVADT